jgi:transcription elongation factor SPT5
LEHQKVLISHKSRVTLSSCPLLVRTSQLQESTEIASGQDKLQGYELHDLVELSGGGATNDIGVIVRVGREEFTVLNNHGVAREVRPEELRGKRNFASAKAVALDVQGHQIRVGDSVNIVEGSHKGKSATIKRMRRAQLFLYSQTRQENAGIFVVRSRSCVLAGSRSRNRPDDTDNRGVDNGGRGARDDTMIGKTVRIQSGVWKGYLGCVADTTPTHVQVELHSRLKKVMVAKDRVSVAGDKFGATEDPDRSSHASNALAGGATPFLGGQTPMQGGQTPMHGGATPMHGGIGEGYTPSHSGGVDDVWRPGGEIDQSAADAAPGESSEQPSGWGASTNENGAWGENGDASGGGGWGASGDSANTGSWGAAGNRSKSTANVSANIASGAENSVTVDGGNDPASGEAPVWFMERVCVEVKSGPQTGFGVIKEVKAGNSAEIELENKATITARLIDVSLVGPKEHDMVLVTGGADVGVEGELVCIDGNDAILKDSNEDFKIVDLVHLAKIESES